MKVLVDRRDALSAVADATVSGVFERGEKDDTFPRSLAKEDEASHGAVKAAWTRKEIRGKRKELTVIHRPEGRGRFVLVGLGPRPRYSAEATRRAVAEVVKGLKGKGARTAAFRLPSFAVDNVDAEQAARAIVDGSILAATSS